MLQHFTTEIGHTFSSPVVFMTELGETTRFAAQYTEYDMPTFGDWCSGTAVIDVEALEVVDSEVSIDKDNPDDLKALEVAERIIEAYKAQEDDYRDDSEWFELCEIAEKVSKREDMLAFGVHDQYDFYKVDEDLTTARFILIHKSHDYHGREFCAKANSHAYMICDVPASRVEQWINDGWGDITDFDFVSEAEFPVYGVVFQNVDRYGDSSPTEQELEGIL